MLDKLGPDSFNLLNLRFGYAHSNIIIYEICSEVGELFNGTSVSGNWRAVENPALAAICKANVMR